MANFRVENWYCCFELRTAAIYSAIEGIVACLLALLAFFFMGIAKYDSAGCRRYNFSFQNKFNDFAYIIRSYVISFCILDLAGSALAMIAIKVCWNF